MQLPEECIKKPKEDQKEKGETKKPPDDFNAGMFLPTDLSGREKVHM